MKKIHVILLSKSILSFSFCCSIHWVFSTNSLKYSLFLPPYAEYQSTPLILRKRFTSSHPSKKTHLLLKKLKEDSILKKPPNLKVTHQIFMKLTHVIALSPFKWNLNGPSSKSIQRNGTSPWENMSKNGLIVFLAAYIKLPVALKGMIIDFGMK